MNALARTGCPLCRMSRLRSIRAAAAEGAPAEGGLFSIVSSSAPPGSAAHVRGGERRAGGVVVAGKRGLSSLQEGGKYDTLLPRPTSEATTAGYKYGIDPDMLREVHPAVRKVLTLNNASNTHRMQAEKAARIQEHQRREADTGSPAAQIAAMTVRLENLGQHCKQFRKDKHSMRGMTLLVARRRRMMQYLKRTDFDSYRKCVQELNLSPVR